MSAERVVTIMTALACASSFGAFVMVTLLTVSVRKMLRVLDDQNALAEDWIRKGIRAHDEGEGHR